MVLRSNVLKLAENLLRERLKIGIIDGLPEVYKPSFGRKKAELLKKINEISKSISKSELAQKLRTVKGFYTLEMAPPKNSEIKQIQDDIKLIKEFFQTGCYKHLTVKQAWLLFLVGTEVGLWFFLGETVGKMHIVGYKV